MATLGLVGQASVLCVCAPGSLNTANSPPVFSMNIVWCLFLFVCLKDGFRDRYIWEIHSIKLGLAKVAKHMHFKIFGEM